MLKETSQFDILFYLLIGAVAGALSAIVIILALGLGAGYYIYLNHKAKAIQVLSAFRKTRRVSSVAVL